MKQKGITPIIAILVILLITIAITGSAWVYISSYYTGMTSEALEITSVDCTGAGATIYIHNIGTEFMDVNRISVTREVIAGSCMMYNGTDYIDSGNQMDVSWDRTRIEPNDIGTFTDANCTRSSDISTARYTIIAGGRVQKVQINC